MHILPNNLDERLKGIKIRTGWNKHFQCQALADPDLLGQVDEQSALTRIDNPGVFEK